jgi:flagellar L-ring protein FlgH
LALLLALPHAGTAQSLFHEGGWRGFTADNKAYRAGDVLTVLVFENTSASSSADTDTRRGNSLAAELAATALPRSWRTGAGRSRNPAWP